MIVRISAENSRAAADPDGSGCGSVVLASNMGHLFGIKFQIKA